MAIQYKSIYDMPQATQLRPTDRFLVATGNADNFTTEAILYNRLSSDTYKILETAKFEVDIIRDRSALNQSGANKVVHTQVINAINNDLTAMMNAYISKNVDFSCTKQWTFSKAPKFTGSYTSSTPGTALATLDWVRSSLNNLARTYPIYTNTWTNQDTGNRRLILSDILPSSLVPSNITIYVMFQNKSTSAYSPTFACTVNGVAQTVELYSGSEKIDYNDKTLKSWSHYRVKLSGLGSTNPVNTVLLDIDTKNSNVMCSLIIYGTHTY